MEYDDIVSSATLLVSLGGAALIWWQLRGATNASKSELLITINRDLNSYSDIAVLIEGKGADPEWVASLDQLTRERLLDYVSYFEGIYLALRRGLFSLEEVNDYFGGRFFRLANNPGVQRDVLCKVDASNNIFRPVFRLHDALSRHRRLYKMAPLFESTSLDQYNGPLYRQLSA